MRLAVAVATALFLSFTALSAQANKPPPGTVGNPKHAPNLSCSIIARECNKACPKEAPADFCVGYCANTKAACLQDGRWTGIRRRYWGVQKK